MAFLYITEYTNIATVGVNLIPVIPTPPLAARSIAISGSSGASSTFSVATHVVMIQPDTTCSLAWSTSSTTVSAVTGSDRVNSNERLFFAVVPGGTVAVISNS